MESKAYACLSGHCHAQCGEIGKMHCDVGISVRVGMSSKGDASAVDVGVQTKRTNVEL